jgi:hypothetical protein
MQFILNQHSSKRATFPKNDFPKLALISVQQQGILYTYVLKIVWKC